MSKTIDSLVTFVPITSYKLGINEFTCLRVKASYDKGRGFRAGFVPAWGNEYVWGCCIDGSGNPLTAGITVDVEPAKRNDAKRLMAIIGNLSKAKEVIAALFDDRQWDKLRGVLHNVGRYGYTDAFRQQAEKMLREREAKSETTISNNSNSETMAENVKAADLIGKVIKINGTDKYYKVLGVDGDKLLTEFHIGEGKEPMSVPLPMANLQGFLEKNVWTIEGEAAAQTGPAAATADDDVQEVEDVQPAKPTAKPKQEKPKSEKAKAEPKAKTEEPKAKAEPKPKTKPEVKATGTLTYETYTSSKGKACARILGFKEDDAVYKNAADIHGSASWNTTKDGRVLYVAFGPRYAAAAKQVCDALNAGKSFDDCKAIIEGTPKATATETKTEKTYTLTEVAAKLKKLLPDGDKATIEDIKKLLEAA